MKLRPSEVAAAVYQLVQVNERLSRGSQLRSGRRGSLSIDCERCRFHDFETGASGGLLDLIVYVGEAATPREAWRWLADRGLSDCKWTSLARRSISDKVSPADQARRLFRAGVSPHGTPVELYLKKRAISLPVIPAIRSHSAAWNVEAHRQMHAMLAAITPTDQPGAVVGVLRTWVTSAGEKVDLASPKKTLGRVAGGGVVLGSVRDAVVVGEGVETTLSAVALFGMPGIATLGASNMAQLRLPSSVDRVIIAHDNDASGVGQRAAEMLARRLWAEGRRVELAAPPAEFKDFNDLAQAVALERRDG